MCPVKSNASVRAHNQPLPPNCFTYVTSNHFLTISPWQVLGYYNRRGINPEAFLNEIKYIASDPDDKHFFNVTDEAALKDIVDALGERIFSLEGLTKEYVT